MSARMVSISWPHDPPVLASQSAGIIGMSHLTWPLFIYLHNYWFIYLEAGRPACIYLFIFLFSKLIIFTLLFFKIEIGIFFTILARLVSMFWPQVLLLAQAPNGWGIKNMSHQEGQLTYWFIYLSIDLFRGRLACIHLFIFWCSYGEAGRIYLFINVFGGLLLFMYLSSYLIV